MGFVVVALRAKTASAFGDHLPDLPHSVDSENLPGELPAQNCRQAGWIPASTPDQLQGLKRSSLDQCAPVAMLVWCGAALLDGLLWQA